MNPEKRETGQCGVEAYLDDPKTCSLYLSDALETGRIDEISGALNDIRRANGSTVLSLMGGGDMSLTEMLDILDAAGVCLVAVPKAATRR